MHVKSPKTVKVLKAKNGFGVFANKPFKRGAKVFQVRGSLMTCYEEEYVDERTRANTIRYDEELYVNPKGFVADYLNHSCEPNVKMIKDSKKLFLVALRDLIKGEEIVMDYSTIIGSDDTWTMDCACGTKSCRGYIGQFRKLPKKLREKYLKLNMVPKYIK